MITKQVTVSGSVGKQVVPTSGDSEAILRGYSIYSPISAGTVVIRDGGSAALSGEIRHEAEAQITENSPEFNFPGKGLQFLKGMHVKVLGKDTVVYLYLD